MPITLPSEDQLSNDLQARLAELDAARAGFLMSPVHWLPDYILLQLAYDVWEQAGATLLVASGQLARAAVANARAALEAVLDMYVLLADPGDYDERGAFIRACELLEKEDNRSYAVRAAQTSGVSTPLVGTVSPDDAVAQDAKQWEAFQPGITVTFQRVLAQAREEGRWKSHWSGIKTFSERAEHVRQKLSPPPGFKENLMAWYRILSQAGHPGPRTGSRSVDWNKPRQVTLGPKEGEGAFPLAAARWACDHAIHALALRQARIR